MPELPEVETVARRLASQVCGKKIVAVDVRWHGSIDRPSVQFFKRDLLQRRIHSVGRRGKFLVFSIRPDLYLLAHLRMSGDFIVCNSTESMGKHVHAVISLVGGRELRFDDTRKFGRLYLVKNPQEVTGNLGLEPLSAEFSVGIFSEMLRQRKGALKPLLLKQSFIAGLGNIYVVESLWRAKLHPLTKANRLRAKDVSVLHRAIREILGEAIRRQGTDIGDSVWKAGEYRTRVYGREGRGCLRCGTTIKRIVVGQRGTEFCPKCQTRR